MEGSPKKGLSYLFEVSYMCEEAIGKILDCLDEVLTFEPNRYMPDSDLEMQSYSRWAAYEIINRMMDHPYELPEIAAEEFLYTMATHAATTEIPEKRPIFEIARDMAYDILMIL